MKESVTVDTCLSIGLAQFLVGWWQLTSLSMFSSSTHNQHIFIPVNVGVYRVANKNCNSNLDWLSAITLILEPGKKLIIREQPMKLRSSEWASFTRLFLTYTVREHHFLPSLKIQTPSPKHYAKVAILRWLGHSVYILRYGQKWGSRTL